MNYQIISEKTLSAFLRSEHILLLDLRSREDYAKGHIPGAVWLDWEHACEDFPVFLENFEKGDYDLILLDIYMPRMTGMQVAEEIRAIDEDAWIIFLTTSRDHALESYNVFASGYVLKPLLENAPQLETLLTRLLPEDALAAKTLTVKLAGGECLSVPYSHILYMDCQGSRGAILHLEDRTLASQNSYQELADILLTDERFLETYHRLILNMNAVTAMKEDTFLLKEDLTLPISRRKKKEVKQQYMQFLLSR